MLERRHTPFVTTETGVPAALFTALGTPASHPLRLSGNKDIDLIVTDSAIRHLYVSVLEDSAPGYAVS